MGVYWMIAFLVLIFIEIITVNLVTIWFAIGAIAGFITAYFTDSIAVQMIVFIVVSIISLVPTRNIVNKLKVKNFEPTNLDRIIGKTGIVTEEISNIKLGEVKVDGKKWSAMSTEKITIGRKVEILSIEGVKLNVKEIKEED